MPLQNRVDPFGVIHAVEARGTFTGNRGVIHDPATRTLLKRRWSTKAWIICTCEFRGRRREVMGRNAPSGNAGWTELFFLDEVTALAAGHRPCFYCRREDATAFASAFAAGCGRSAAKATEMDVVLHGERLASARSNAQHLSDLAALPPGTMIAAEGKPYALGVDKAFPWTFSGYGMAIPLAALQNLDPLLLTPPSSVATLRAGYRPRWHGTAPAPP